MCVWGGYGFGRHLDDLHVAVGAAVVVDGALPARVPAEEEQVEVVRGRDEVARVELGGLEERVARELGGVRLVVVEEAAEHGVLPWLRRAVAARCARARGGGQGGAVDPRERV